MEMVDLLIRVSGAQVDLLSKWGCGDISGAVRGLVETERNRRIAGTTVASWFAERCVRVTNHRARRGELFDDYVSWCSEQDHVPLGRTVFYKTLHREGYTAGRSASLRYLRHLRLKHAETQEGGAA